MSGRWAGLLGKFGLVPRQRGQLAARDRYDV